MKKKSFSVLSALSLSLLLCVGCAKDTEEYVPKAEELSAPRILTRTGSIPTTSSFIGLDANQDLTFCYAAERENTEGSQWEWSDKDSEHPKTVDGKELSQLAVVMPGIDINTGIYHITQEDLGNYYSLSGILWGVAGCPEGNPPNSFEAKQQLAKLFVERDEKLLEYTTSFTLYLAPSANLDVATGMSLTSPNEVEAFTYSWTSGQKTFSVPIFPQVFEKGSTIMEYQLDGETHSVELQNTITVGPNQALVIKFTASSSSPLIEVPPFREAEW